MRRFLLDTNTVSYLWDGEPIVSSQIAARISQCEDRDRILISVLSLLELEYGFACASSPERQSQFRKAIDRTKDNFSLVPVTEDVSSVYGHIKRQYQQEMGITPNVAKRNDIDLILASTAIAKGMVLVSNDKIFKTIQRFRNDFRLENWAR